MTVLKDFEKESFYYQIMKDGEENELSRTLSSTNILTHLCNAHPQSNELNKNNNELSLVDYIHSTTRFNRPYLNFCGKTSNISRLQICLAFLLDEKISDY